MERSVLLYYFQSIELNCAALIISGDDSARLDSHLRLVRSFFPEVDPADSSPRGGSGGNTEHGHRVGEAGSQLMWSQKRKTSRLNKQTVASVQEQC